MPDLRVSFPRQSTSGRECVLPSCFFSQAIDVWTGVCLTFVFGALLEFALVNYASRSDLHVRERQRRAQWQGAEGELFPIVSFFFLNCQAIM